MLLFLTGFVMPMIKDSRNGISEHRKEVMEIMSHGGGVGSNVSTLRPKEEPLLKVLVANHLVLYHD